VSEAEGSLVDRVAVGAFALGLAGIAFGYGFVAAKHRLFPYEQVSKLEQAADAFYKTYLQPASRATQGLALPARDGRFGAVTHDAALVAPGLTFMTLYAPEGFEARLVDPAGEVVHRWRARHSEVFPNPTHLMWKAPDEFIVWHGAALLPNGDVLFNFQDKSFPYGGGLVRLDKDSRVVWALPANTHHDVVVEEDGTIVVPSMHYRPEGIPETPHLVPWYYEDTVLRVSPSGEVLGETSVLKALLNYPGLITINYSDDTRVEASDLTHLNGAEPLPAALAGSFPQWAPGDLLVSLRNINTVAVIDPGTGRTKWSITGPFAKQHDADYLPNGRIMLFDNAGGDPACGRSRILEIDPASQAVTWSYDGCGGGPKFDSDIRGMQQLLPNGNVLVTESVGGRAFEVTREGRIVWEYVNAIGEIEGRPRVGLVTHAERIPPEALDFLGAAPGG
jgi:hypothetical protein